MILNSEIWLVKRQLSPEEFAGIPIQRAGKLTLFAWQQIGIFPSHEAPGDKPRRRIRPGWWHGQNEATAVVGQFSHALHWSSGRAT
jgi:hypothetical protein